METSNKKFNKPLIVYRIKTPKVFDFTKEIIKYLIDNNYVEYIYLENLKEINSEVIFGNKEKEKEKYFKSFEISNEDSNLCIIIGGDGTCLWANRLYKSKNKPPFLCFHGGNLGFLAIYYPEKYKDIFNELYKTENYKFISRKEIKCTVYEKEKKDENEKDDTNLDITNFEGYKEKITYNALNELTLEKNSNMSHLCLFLENHELAKVSSDGLICSTPTGSTAYSLSAGGPILHNNVEGIIVTAICPFSLSFRPIVLPPNIKLRVKTNPEFPNFKSLIKMDGHNNGPLELNQYLEISLSEKCIDFLVLKNTEEHLDKLWIQKISKSLGWNYAFNH